MAPHQVKEDEVADTPAGSHAHAHTSPEAPSSAVTRSQFLTLSSVGLGATIGAVIGVPAVAYVLAPVTEESTFEPVYLGKTDAFQPRRGTSSSRSPPSTSRPRPSRPPAPGWRGS